MLRQSTYTLETSLGHLAGRFSRVILRRLDAELAAAGLGITADHYLLLVHLWEQDGLTQGALAERSAKDKTTMARLAAALEQRGLIVRRPGATDRRELLLSLTTAGKVIMDRATGLAEEILADARRGISEEDLALCRDVLKRACQNIFARTDEPPHR